MAVSLARTASADAATVSLFTGHDIGESLARAVVAIGGVDAEPAAAVTPLDAACDPRIGGRPRFAILSRGLTADEVASCQNIAGADVVPIKLGYRAVAVVASATSPVWALATTDLFSAVSLQADRGQAPSRWSDVNPSYPSLPIALLAPPAGSDGRELFEGRVIMPGCNAGASRSASASCGALRSEPVVVARTGGWEDVAKWASGAKPGELNVVTTDELRHLDTVVVPLPLDGALPTAANIDSGRYPAAEPISLLIVLPHGVAYERRNQAWQLAFNLLAETSIGPSGALAAAGLVPLSPTDRTAARSHVHDFLAGIDQGGWSSWLWQTAK